MKQAPGLSKRVHQGLKLRKRVKRQRTRFGHICARSYDGLAIGQGPVHYIAMSKDGWLTQKWSTEERKAVWGDLVPWNKMTGPLIAQLEQTRWVPHKDKPWLVQLAECAL